MITVKADSVGGTPCLVFYDGIKPVYTLWESAFQEIINHGPGPLGLSDAHGEELYKIITTTRALGGDWDQVNAAVTAYLNNLQEK